MLCFSFFVRVAIIVVVFKEQKGRQLARLSLLHYLFLFTLPS